MLSLDKLKSLYIEQLDYIVTNDTILQPANKNQINSAKDAVSKASTLTQLGAAIMVPKSYGNTGFNPIEPFDKDVLYYTPFQTDKAPLDWYFMYGNCGSFAFTFIIFALPVCNPIIANKHNYSGNQVCIYNVSGGYGALGGPWITIPYSFCQANYNVLSQTTLTWSGIFDVSNPIINANFTITGQGQFLCDVSWKTDNDIVGFTASLLSAEGPFLNGPNACFPCIYGIGSSYYSYTNMNVIATAGGKLNKTTGSGVGWLDHQWLQQGQIQSITTAALINITNYFSTPTVLRWFWLTIQDSVNSVQYMVSVFPKDVLDINKPLEITTKTTIKYNKYTGPKYLNDTTTVKVLSMTTINGIVFPTKHLVTIKEGDYTVQYILEASFGNSIVHLPSGILNWEGAGTLYDGSGKTILGNCFLEANQMEKEEDILNTVCKTANIQSSYDIFSIKNSQVPTFTLLLSMVWILILISIGIFIIWCIYKLVKKGWNCYEETDSSPVRSPVETRPQPHTSIFKKHSINKNH
jgi:hypothetical protein